MTDLEKRLRNDLEPILELADPREKLSAYHDMPYALFQYEAEDEWEMRKHVTMLCTRLDQRGKRVHRISLAECLDEAVRSQASIEEWVETEKSTGTEMLVDTIHSVLAETAPLVDLVSKRLPLAPDPLRDIVFVVRTGALFPVYRTFSLLEQLKGRVVAPTVLFYPGKRDGAAGLRYMGILEAEHNYRPKVF
jgi:hypothetical protein